MKKYTAEIEKQLKETYNPESSDSEREEQLLACVDLVMEDGDDTEKVKRSVRGKLASMKHYKAIAKVKEAKRKVGKGDIIGEIAQIMGEPVTSLADLSKSTIPVLAKVAAWMKEHKQSEAQEVPTVQ